MTLRQRLYPHGGPSARATLCRTLNVVLAVGSVVCLLLSIGTLHARAPLGLMLAVLGLPCQVLFGLLPTFYFVGKERLSGAAKRAMLWPAMGGSLVWTVAVAVGLIFGEGGC
jgi:hypothetical protein